MAKKQKRQVSHGPRLSEAQRQMAPQAPRAATTTTGSVRPSLSSEFNPDYSYVLKDLKKIAILAGSFITILVVLSFFLG